MTVSSTDTTEQMLRALGAAVSMEGALEKLHLQTMSLHCKLSCVSFMMISLVYSELCKLQVSSSLYIKSSLYLLELLACWSLELR